MTTVAAPTGPAPGARQTVTPQHASAPWGRFAPRTDVCSDGLPTMDCPFCWGPESD